MMETKRPYTAVKHILAYLIILICLALGVTLLLTHNKGWDSRELETAIEQSRLRRKAVRSLDVPTRIRPPAAAGIFYSADPSELYQQIDNLIAAAKPLKLHNARSLLVPHAAYIYSGDVAAAGYREVVRDFERVFILAANHTSEADFKGVSLPDFSHYEIPGARIPLSSMIDELLADPLFVREPAAHTKYVLEVQLPFLYGLKEGSPKKDFTIIPMIVGRLDTNGVSRLAQILNRYADDRTIFIFSVDLSHFHPDSKARQLDSFTIQSILARDSAALAKTTTDGPQVLSTLVQLAELNGWDATLLRYKNSGAVSGDRSKVVGYAAIAFHDPFVLNGVEKRELLKLARTAIAEYLTNGDFSAPDADLLDRHAVLRIPRGVFVTLKKNGRLRGCIGDIISANPLHEGVQLCAVRSAVRDARFSPVTPAELNDLVISISVLAFPNQVKVNSPLDFPDVIRPGQDGIIMVHAGKRSTFLPQVWDEIPDPVEFLSRLCLKQDSPADCWQDSRTRLFRYTALEFGEEAHENL